MHYDVVANGVLWFLAPRPVRPDPPPALRSPLPRRVGRVRRRQRGVRRRGRCRARARARHRARAGLPARARPRAAPRPPARPPRRALHAHAVLRSRRHLRAARRRRRPTLCASLGIGTRRVPHTAVGRRVPPVRRCGRSGREASVVPPFAAPLGPDVAALEEVAASPEARRAAGALADTVGDRLVILRTDRIEPSKNIVRGFLAYDRLLEARPGLRGRVVFVAMVYPSRQGLAEYLAYANEVEQAVDARQRPLGDARLDADRARRPRRLRPLGRRPPALRRAGREPVARRTEPRRQGRARRATGATACCACRPRRAPTRSSRRPRSRCTPTTSSRPRARSTPRSRCRSTTAPYGPRTCATLATARTPSDWLHDLVGHAGRVARRARPVRRRGRRPTPRARAAPPPSRRRSAPRVAARRRRPRRRAPRTPAGRRCRRPTNAPTSKPVDELARDVALVDRDRRAELDGHAGAQQAEPVAACDVVGGRAGSRPRAPAPAASAA